VTIVCDSDTDLAPGNAQAFDIEFSPRAAFRQGFVSVQGSVTSSTPDTNLADNRAGSTVPIR
jgi:hypothetical protein